MSRRLPPLDRLALSRERLRRSLQRISTPPSLAGMVLADSVKAVLQPVAQRNPLGLVLGAAVLGGLFVQIRPWRWISKPTLFAGLLPQLLSSATTHLRRLPWLAIVTLLAQQQSRTAKPGLQAGSTLSPTHKPSKSSKNP